MTTMMIKLNTQVAANPRSLQVHKEAVSTAHIAVVDNSPTKFYEFREYLLTGYCTHRGWLR